MRRRFRIRTYGCQMNVHDSEKVANLLLHAGWEEAPSEDAAELLVINTCSVRAKAENKLYSDLGALRAWKKAEAGRLLAVGGCVAQQEGDTLLRRFPHLDFVFGTHNLRWVPAMADAAARGHREARTSQSDSPASALERFDLPERHPAYRSQTPGRAFLTVMEGCDMFCSFCIVPTTRGREVSRPAPRVLEEARELADRGVCELTLLGQTVNAYGRHDLRRGRAEEAATLAFGELLARLADIPGIERIRYTSPHPLFFDAALVRAHGELPELCPHVHLPLQSGSDAVLRAMRRRYGADDYRRWADRLREARPDLAITTDLIVGFPGETDADFRLTLELVQEIGFVDSYSFKYSARPGTAAHQLDAKPVDGTTAQARLEELQTLQRSLTLAAHRKRVGGQTEVLIEGPSRRDGALGPQLQGRDPYHRVVNLSGAHLPPRGPGAADEGRGIGEIVRVEIVEATPHSLIGEPLGRGADRHSGLKHTGRMADEEGRREALP